MLHLLAWGFAPFTINGARTLFVHPIALAVGGLTLKWSLDLLHDPATVAQQNRRSGKTVTL